jgi:hypothetical protein
MSGMTLKTLVTALIVPDFMMQAVQNVMSSTCIIFRPKVSGDLDWMSIETTGISGCWAKAQ